MVLPKLSTNTLTFSQPVSIIAMPFHRSGKYIRMAAIPQSQVQMIPPLTYARCYSIIENPALSHCAADNADFA